MNKRKRCAKLKQMEGMKNNCCIEGEREREGKKNKMHVRVKFKYRIKIMRDRTDFPR